MYTVVCERGASSANRYPRECSRRRGEESRACVLCVSPRVCATREPCTAACLCVASCTSRGHLVRTCSFGAPLPPRVVWRVGGDDDTFSLEAAILCGTGAFPHYLSRAPGAAACGPATCRPSGDRSTLFSEPTARSHPDDPHTHQPSASQRSSAPASLTVHPFRARASSGARPRPTARAGRRGRAGGGRSGRRRGRCRTRLGAPPRRRAAREGEGAHHRAGAFVSELLVLCEGTGTTDQPRAV